MELRLGELQDGDEFQFGNVDFEVVQSIKSTDRGLALCRIKNHCANLYISADAWVLYLQEN